MAWRMAGIMVKITPERFWEKMKMVSGWLREGPGAFARIAKNEKHVKCRSGKRGSGIVRIIHDHADDPFATT